MGLVVTLGKGETLQESLWKWGSLAHSTWSWIHLADPRFHIKDGESKSTQSDTWIHLKLQNHPFRSPEPDPNVRKFHLHE